MNLILSEWYNELKLDNDDDYVIRNKIIMV